jgi:hypothetical protein
MAKVSAAKKRASVPNRIARGENGRRSGGRAVAALAARFRWMMSHHRTGALREIRILLSMRALTSGLSSDTRGWITRSMTIISATKNTASVPRRSLKGERTRRLGGRAEMLGAEVFPGLAPVVVA